MKTVFTQQYDEVRQVHPVLARYLESQRLLFDYEVRLPYLFQGVIRSHVVSDFIAWDDKQLTFYECKPFCQPSLILHAIWQLRKAAECVMGQPSLCVVVPQDTIRRDTQQLCSAEGVSLLVLDIPGRTRYRNPFKSANRRIFDRLATVRA